MDEDNVRQSVKLEMAPAEEQFGHLTIWHTIRLVHKIHAPRKVAAEIL